MLGEGSTTSIATVFSVPWLRGIASKLVFAHFRQHASRETVLDQSAMDWLEVRFAKIHKQSGDSFAEKAIGASRLCGLAA